MNLILAEVEMKRLILAFSSVLMLAGCNLNGLETDQNIILNYAAEARMACYLADQETGERIYSTPYKRFAAINSACGDLPSLNSCMAGDRDLCPPTLNPSLAVRLLNYSDS